MISNSAPALSEKFAIFGYGSGEVQAVFKKWNSCMDTTISGGRSGRALSVVEDIVTSPVIDGSTVFVANGSGRIGVDLLTSVCGKILELLEIFGRRVIVCF